MTSRTSSILTIAGISICGILAYAVYFDYKRRTDSDFRKKIRKEKKRVDRSLAQSREALAAANELSEAELREALKLIKSEPQPPTQEGKENYFMSQVAMGEQLATKGEPFYLPAALSFYRALEVYPSKPELLAIYEKTVPEPIVKIILGLLNLDSTLQSADRAGAYWRVFPPAWTNVSIRLEGTGSYHVLLEKDVAAGEVIYKEHPIMTCVDYDLQAAGTHCTRCLREIEPALGSLPLISSAGTKSVFCSKPCQIASKTQWHSFLLTLEPPLPAVPELSILTSTAAALETRRAAQVQFMAYLEKESRIEMLLLAKILARQLTTVEKTPSVSPNDYAGADNAQYRMEDHIARWMTLAVDPSPEEQQLLVDLFRATFPGLEQYITEDIHKSFLGRIKHNAFGVCFGGGRDDRPTSLRRPEDEELTRTPYGTARQVGTALYSVSAHLPHSCVPNARPSFSSGTAELHLIANKDLKKGDELTIAYVDVTQRPDESSEKCRLRRRKELARGWKFACHCPRCVKEAPANEKK
ncbi:hypothetical protein C8J57DRAFT_1391059 [Mycena rebaudengoi]|nr:hypothetical protein C8J57DRAFT_1391059 [Mycena rebaudengoi]